MIEPRRPERESWLSIAARLQRLEDYKDEVSRILTTVPRETVDLWSIFRDDALALSCFLDSVPGTVSVLDVGTFVGVSAFLFACQPNVRQVITVDPNPYVQDEIRSTAEVAGIAKIPEMIAPNQTRVQDVARAALDNFPAERAKIRFEVGVISGGGGAVREVAVPEPSACGADRLVVFLDGLHSSSAVYSDLAAILAAEPDAVVFLDDCRYFWGPFVQAGVAKFLGANPQFKFELTCDSSSILGTCTLGIVSHVDLRRTVDEALERVIETVGANYETLGANERIVALQEQVLALQHELADSVRTVGAMSDTVEQMRQSLAWRIGERVNYRKWGRRLRRR